MSTFPCHLSISKSILACEYIIVYGTIHSPLAEPGSCFRLGLVLKHFVDRLYPINTCLHLWPKHRGEMTQESTCSAALHPSSSFYSAKGPAFVSIVPLLQHRIFCFKLIVNIGRREEKVKNKVSLLCLTFLWLLLRQDVPFCLLSFVFLLIWFVCSLLESLWHFQICDWHLRLYMT